MTGEFHYEMKQEYWEGNTGSKKKYQCQTDLISLLLNFKY